MLLSFTMCFLDRVGFPILKRDFLEKDDSAAMIHARDAARTHVIELFQGARLVARIPKGGVALGPPAGAPAPRRTRPRMARSGGRNGFAG